MEDIVTSVKRLASNTDEAGHQTLMDGLRDLSYSIETPGDTFQRLAYAVGLALEIMGLVALTSSALTNRSGPHWY